MHSSNLIRDRSNLIEWCLFMLVAIASMHCAWAVNGFDPYEFLRRGSDQLGYYQWLPAFFVDQDFGKMYWCHQMESGKWISMFTFGVALLQLPFFLFGQLSAEAFGYDLNGFSPPYAIAQMVGVALYTGAGVVLAYRIARRFSTEESALLAVVALFAATNLFYYSVYAPTMSHGYSFFLVGLFCYSALRFLDGPENPVRSIHVVLLVLSGSLLVFVRQLNIIVFIFPLLMVYRSTEGFPGFLRTLMAHRPTLITTGVLVLVPWVLQGWYWYNVTGDPFTFTYGKKDEHFEFTKMVPGRVLFDVRNGWLIYTPLMIPVLVVLIKHAWRNTAGARATGLVFLLTWLLYSAWWCWWLGTGYGYRGFVDLYALLVIPLAWVFRSVFARPLPVRIFAALTMVALIYLNFGLMEKFTWEWSWENWTWQLYFGEVGRIFGGVLKLVVTTMSSIYDRIPSSLRIALAAIWPAALLLYGLWSFPLAIFGPDRELIPGDLGDARFNNYILEHFHQYATGKVDAYWDAPFMYPYKNVIALSDNLLGSAPLYSLFRHVGYNRESAFQFWVLAVFALNYLCCYIALVLWSKRSALAAAGAFVFAFGIHMIGHLEHAQVFPKFMVPMAFWFCWQWLRSGKVRHFLFTGLAVVYQFYCGIYLGFMLCYALLFLVAGYLLVNRTIMGRIRNPNWSVIRSSAGVLVLSAGLLLPLMLPYMEVANSLGTRTFDEVKATIPRPVSYFFTHPAAMSWRSLSGHSQFAFDEWWSHFHFMGAVPWLAIFLLPVVAWRANVEPAQRKGLLAIGIALVLSTVFCLRIGDFTLYKLIYKLPGFSAMRAIDRIVTVQAMYFALLTTLVFSLVGKRPWQKALIGLCIPLMILMDNKVVVGELYRFNKYAAKAMVDRVVLDMQLQRDPAALALAYTPARCVMTFQEDHERTINIHLSAMLAGQQIGMPVVNAYTGSYPGNYFEFWDSLDLKTLGNWCQYNNKTSEGIQLINNIRQPILATDTVYLMAANGAYVCLNSDQENLAIADRSTPQRWETFVLLGLSPGRSAFLTHTDQFLSAELHHDGRLSATSDQLGDMGIFKEVPLPDDQVALLADNGKYVELDRTNNGLVARSDSIGPDTRFRILR